jgi:eukaryotic-like serine/threonine-protein kinase
MTQRTRTSGFFKEDWFVALLIGIAFLAASLSGTTLLERTESAAYDAGVRLTHRNPGATESIAIVAIDDPSVEQIGRWPWSRTILAQMLATLAKGRPRAVALLIFLTEPQTDPGLDYIRRIREVAGNGLRRFPHGREIGDLLSKAERELDADGRLADSLPALGNVYLQMFLQPGRPLGRPDAPLPEFVSRNRVTKVVKLAGVADHTTATTNVLYPLAQFGEPTRGIGYLEFFPDASGGVRNVPLVLEHYGEYYPALPLLLAARDLNLTPKDIEVRLGEGVRLGRLSITTDDSMEMLTGFYPPKDAGESAFATYSFRDILTEKVPPTVFRNKIVLIGATATGVGTAHVTPVSAAMSDPELTANVVASLLNQDFYTRPAWTFWAEIGIFLVVTLYLMFALPRMSAKIAALVTVVLLLLLVGGEQFLLVGEKIWLRDMTPALLLFVGHVALTTKHYFLTERQKIAAESDSAQTNRMLGLAFQGQGQLDMAMDKFRKLPVDDSVLDLIYNLALDYERKRQFNKAGAAYAYITGHNPAFRDVRERRKRTLQAEQTVMLGGGITSPGGTLILDGSGQKPTLGRYEVEKELGKGAMGTVYLGRDPKINRIVAIKTLALQEFDDAELPQVKERFFREAETAGRLNHPNIVTIYDAGEEHDLAYIAMELLQGKDLAFYARQGKPLSWVLDVTLRIVEALDYAHRQDVVHRDIKPANIMFNEADNTLKVTDFGIARITASSRTKTGVILGTPSYMSPEQVAGKHVDGRSDLFSLGILLYELATGKLPFTGDSLATLMYQIANVPHADARRLRPDLPDCVIHIIDHLLEKDPAARYQTGAEVKRDLLPCLDTVRAKETVA